MALEFKLPTGNNKLYRGDTIPFNLVISQGGVPKNLTLYAVWMTFKKNETDSDTAPTTIQKTIANGGIVVTDAPNGACRCTLQPSDTASLPGAQTYIADVQIKRLSDGAITTVAKGTVDISVDITLNTT